MNIYEFGPFRVDASKRLLLRDGNQIKLPAKAFEILLVLLEEKGRLVEKDELMRRVWSDAAVEENNLTVNISALRKSLSESPGEHRYVLTVPGRGYQFVADVQQPDAEPVTKSERGQQRNELESEFTVEGKHETTSHPDLSRSESGSATAPLAAVQTNGVKVDLFPFSKAGSNEDKLNRLNSGVLILASILFAGVSIVSYLAYARYHAVSSKPGITSIAVLPFANDTGDQNADYLSDGISESLINSLSQLPGVKVSARSSTLKYKGAPIDLDEIARTLGVEAILTGTVRQRGDNLSINVELVNASDKTQMWGEQYDRKMSDLLPIQREITREIVEKLKPKVSGEVQRPAKHYTESNEAYQLYLKGRFYWNKRTPEALKKSIEYFNQAIDKDPSFALAYAGLADSYVVPASGLAPRDAMPKAKAAAIRALQLDETLAEAHASLGRVFAAYDWDWTSAEKEYKRAIELNPRYAVAHQWYGGYLSVMGRGNEAIVEKKRAVDLEPLSLTINFELGLAFYFNRDYDHAIEQFQKTVDLDQNFQAPHSFLPAALEQKRMYSEAIAEFHRAIPLTPGSEGTLSKAGLAHVYAVTGRKTEALQLLDELKQLSTDEYVPGTSTALIYAGLGDKEKAFADLEKGYEQRAFQLQWIRLDPRWDSLRSDPRFHELLRRLNIPE